MVRKTALIRNIVLALLVSTPVFAKPNLTNPSLVAKAKAAVADGTKDPSSVQFRNVKIYNNTKYGPKVCGQFNAKNAYGGYVGFQGFVFDGNFAIIADDGIRYEVANRDYCQ